jgi:N-acetylmuramoyl-L-alanine amidase
MKKFKPAVLLLVFAGISALISAQTPGAGYENARALAKKHGFLYRWFPIQRVVIISHETNMLRLTLDSNEAVFNNQPVKLASPPVLREGEVLVPGASILGLIRSAAKPPTTSPPKVILPGPPAATPAAMPTPTSPIPIASPVTPPVIPAEIIQPPPQLPGDGLALLAAVRSSSREDHTRIVLEFDGTVRYRPEGPTGNKYKLRLEGCKNVFPTKRPNPNPRDVGKVTFNSGPNRQGLVITFDLPEGAPEPKIETVNNPFRMVVSFFTPTQLPAAPIATATAAIPVPASAAIRINPPASAAVAIKPPAIATATVSPSIAPAVATAAKSPVASAAAKIPPAEPPQKAPGPVSEIAINVPLETLSKGIFLGRTIIIDPGHGGKDSGVESDGLPAEKEIALNIGLKLRDALKEIGFKTFLLRGGETDLSQADRLSMANRAGGDLLVSVHAGNSHDDTQQGPTCFFYSPSGVSLEPQGGMKLSPQLVFKEWTSTYRFDLAKFLGNKLQKRLTSHLSAPDRGIQGAPLTHLQFLLVPGVLVEVGMLSNPEESGKLASPAYQNAVARALANGIVDFFNSLKVE